MTSEQLTELLKKMHEQLPENVHCIFLLFDESNFLTCSQLPNDVTARLLCRALEKAQEVL